MRIIASYSIKGGVGKTAAAVNFAHIAAASGQRVLLIDLDPQGASSYYFRVKPSKKLKPRLFIKQHDLLLQNIRGSDYPNLDILPANLSYRNFDVMLNDMRNSTDRLGKVLKPLKNDYDLVIIDCPPGLTLLSENVFCAADLLLVPVIPTTLSQRTLQQLWTFFKKKSYETRKILPFLSMVNYRTRMHNEVARSLRKNYKRLLRGYIPLSAEIEKMGIHRAPVGAFARHHIACRSYEMMFEEIRQRIAKT